MFKQFISEGVIPLPPPSHELPLLGLIYIRMYECLILPLPHALQIMHFFLKNLLTLRLLMSYIYGAPSKARNANVVYIWTYVWQR